MLKLVWSGKVDEVAVDKAFEFHQPEMDLGEFMEMRQVLEAAKTEVFLP